MYKVYSENWERSDEVETLREARALRYQKYGYAGYIIEYDDEGNEIANHS